MYNGIGLQTARGSGTNGYVQKNLSHVRHHKDKASYKTEEQLKKLDESMNKGPNLDILKHEKRRKVELKCLEMEELMEEQGYDAEEIQQKVSLFRQVLLEKEEAAERSLTFDEMGRPVTKDTHQLAEANQEKNANLRAAFGISEFYIDGSSLDPNRKQKELEAAKAKELEAKAKAMALKKYEILKDSASDDEEPKEKPDAKKKKKKSKSKKRDSSAEKEVSTEKSRSHKVERSEESRTVEEDADRKHSNKSKQRRSSKERPSEQKKSHRSKKHEDAVSSEDDKTAIKSARQASPSPPRGKSRRSPTPERKDDSASPPPKRNKHSKHSHKHRARDHSRSESRSKSRSPSNRNRRRITSRDEHRVASRSRSRSRK